MCISVKVNSASTLSEVVAITRAEAHVNGIKIVSHSANDGPEADVGETIALSIDSEFGIIHIHIVPV